MKVLLVNGSPKANGNTARALAEVAEQLNAEGIDTEAFQLGTKPIRVATLHLDGVDRQPVSILNELKALLKEAPQVPGTKLN